MGLFGKILIGINLLASGGFVYLALQDYKPRQTINAAGLRHQMEIVGLPLDGPDTSIPAKVDPSSDDYSDFVNTAIPFEIEGPGSVKTRSVSPALLYAYFAQAGESAPPIGGTVPVASQMAEVKRVWGIIRATLDKTENRAEKMQLAAGWLLLQAETIEERNDYLEWIAKGNLAEITHALDIKFHRVAPDLVRGNPINPDLWSTLETRINALKAERDAALKAAQDAESGGNMAEAEAKRAEAGVLTRRIDRRNVHPPLDEPDRRYRLADLLVHLDLAAAWQKRTLLVVGITQYVKAVDSHAGYFKEMSERVARVIADDQERFSAQYAQLRTQAIQRTQLVLEMAEIKAQLTIQAQKDQDLVNQRTLQLEDLTAQRAAVKAEVNQLLAKQTLVEQKLFAVERDIGLTLEDIYRLDAELRMRELERYGQKK
jgi:hypothetical protein